MSALLASRWTLIDIGINLTDAMYKGKYQGKQYHASDLENVVERAAEVGVVGGLITGGNLRESREAIELCKLYSCTSKQYFSTVGCHPTRCSEFVENPETYYNALDDLIGQHSVHNGGCVAAVGEVGLDYDRLFFCPKDIQLRYFEKQLDLAEKHKLPLFLHDRNTGGDFYAILSQNVSRLHGCVVHSFTGTAEELCQYLELGCYIGVNGCSFKTKENVETVSKIPLDRILIETDGPWCDVRNTHASREILNAAGERNSDKKCFSDSLLSKYNVCKKEKFKNGSVVKGRCEPCHLVCILEVLFEMHRDHVTDLEAMSRIILRNTISLFPFRERISSD